MKEYTYTKRELQIIRTKEPLAIADEEILVLYNKAYRRNDLNCMNHLVDVYPDVSDRLLSFDFQLKIIESTYEEQYIYPILCPTDTNSEGRIKNIVTYLTGQRDWPESLRKRLYDTIPYRLVFDYWLEEFVRDYEAAPLWEVYFTGQQELARPIKQRRITSLEELVYRTVNYFEHYNPNISAQSAEMSD